jgi:hypothetical protein
LRWLVAIGLFLLFAMFVIYATGFVTSEVPISEVPDYWSLSASELAEVTGTRGGWGWIETIASGSTLALAALVFFPASTIVLIVIAGFLYLRNKVPAYAAICFFEAAVLLVAAAGIIGAGH